MLESLHISNYALIDSIDIDLHHGFNVITGETGAGKSIILGALSLILGGRADSRVVSNPEAKSVIEAVFDVDGNDRLKEFCIENDIEWDDSRCILRREIAPAGRSRAFVNDSPVPLSKLQAVALRLIDIHSQHQNQLLSTPEFQLQVIDRLAGNEELLKEYTVRYNSLRDVVKSLKSLRARVTQNREDEEFLRFQLDQIEELSLLPGEQAELENEREVLTNLSSLKSSLENSLNALVNSDSNVVDLIASASDALSDAGKVLPENEDIMSRLESARIEIADIASTLEAVDSRLVADPSRLEAVEERLGSIYTLCHKHHVDDSDALIAVRDSLRERLAALDSGEEQIAALEKEARRAKALARETAVEISRRRSEEASLFSSQLQELASPLGMKNLRVEMTVTLVDMCPTGIDSVQLMVAFNKNQELMPVGATASGGEISRLMLTVKSIIASRIALPSIIFDEIDTGVSGDVANRMALMMRDISRSIQVTAITHLPQVASKGDTHFKVYKEDDDKATHTHIVMLSAEERINAIAGMLGGSTIDDAARKAALSLLSQ